MARAWAVALVLPVAIIAALSAAPSQRAEGLVERVLPRTRPATYRQSPLIPPTYFAGPGRATLRRELDLALSRWARDRRPVQAVFLLELARHGLVDLRELTQDRSAGEGEGVRHRLPDAPGRNPREDAFEVAWHRTAIAAGGARAARCHREGRHGAATAADDCVAGGTRWRPSRRPLDRAGRRDPAGAAHVAGSQGVAGWGPSRDPPVRPGRHLLPEPVRGAGSQVVGPGSARPPCGGARRPRHRGCVGRRLDATVRDSSRLVRGRALATLGRTDEAATATRRRWRLLPAHRRLSRRSWRWRSLSATSAPRSSAPASAVRRLPSVGSVDPVWRRDTPPPGAPGASPRGWPMTPALRRCVLAAAIAALAWTGASGRQ